MQLRRMADASLALAERRPDDLKAAVEKLGQEAPSNRQLFAAAAHGPPRPAGQRAVRTEGPRLRDDPRCWSIVACWWSASGIAKLITLPFGGAGTLVDACCSGS